MVLRGMLKLPITLTRERAELAGRASRTGWAHGACVARTLLLLPDGRTYQTIAESVGR